MFVLFCPIALVFFLLIALLALLFHNYFVSLLFLLLAFGLNSWCECFTFPFFAENETKNAITIKALCFNVKSTQDNFDENAPLIAQKIIEEDADIVFLPELYDYRAKYLLPFLREKYPYISRNEDGRALSSVAFLSKWPLDVCKRIEVDRKLIANEFGLDELALVKDFTKKSSIYKTAITVNEKHITVIGAHLVGNNFYSNKNSYSIDSINSFGYLKAYLKNVHESYHFRALQADAVCREMDSISTPLIVMGDMNDIGGSYAVRSFEGKGLDDAWWNGGFGYGSTFEQGFLRLRLDHVFYSPESLQLKNVKTIDTGLSDHKCLVATFAY